MEMKGEQVVPAPQADTWAALNDPEILKACIPGCESIERVTDAEYAVRMTARVGPVAAKFKGKLTLSDLKPPQSYSIAFEGQGGVAGFGKGSAQVRLASEGKATRLSYQVKANVGGKLAQIGSRLVEGGPAHEEHEEHAEHSVEPVPRDPDLPDVPPSSLAFFAAGALVVSIVALMALF